MFVFYAASKVGSSVENEFLKQRIEKYESITKMYDYSIPYHMSNKYSIAYLYNLFTKTFMHKKGENWSLFASNCHIKPPTLLHGHLPNIFLKWLSYQFTQTSFIILHFYGW